MAEGFANYYGKHLLEATSAGSRPAGFIMPETVEVMKEKGVDISHQGSKGLSKVKLDWMDWVVVLEVSLVGSIRLPSRHTQQLSWAVPDPVGRTLDFYRSVRDEIQAKVLDFIDMVRKEV